MLRLLVGADAGGFGSRSKHCPVAKADFEDGDRMEEIHVSGYW